jgi:proteasome lid subunit RPN8/RPN11
VTVGPEPVWPVAHLVELAERSPATEACGLMVRAGGGIEPWPITNVAPLPASAFELDPAGLLEALRRLDRGGGMVVAVYHSHLSGGADLSARDLVGAQVGGQPIWPGVAQLVVALDGGRARRVRLHRWTGRSFQAADLWWR